MLSFLSVFNTTPLIYESLVVALCERGRCAAHEITTTRIYDGAFFLQGSLHPKGCIPCAHVALRSLLHSFNVSFRQFCFQAFDLGRLAGVLVRSVHQHLENFGSTLY